MTEENQDYSKLALEKIEKLLDDLGRARLYEFVSFVQRPWRMFWMNFMIGVARGLGLTIGTAIVLSISYQILQHLMELNIPFITEWVADWITQIMSIIKKG